MTNLILVVVFILAYAPLIMWVFWDLLEPKIETSYREFDWKDADV